MKPGNTNDEYYEKFNTRCEVAKAVGVTRLHKAAVTETSMDLYKKVYDDLTDDEKVRVEEEAEERYLTYVFIQQSSSKNNKLKEQLHDAFVKRSDQYPKNRQEALHYLNKHTKSQSSATAISEGTTFATTGKNGKSGKAGRTSSPRRSR